MGFFGGKWGVYLQLYEFSFHLGLIFHEKPMIMGGRVNGMNYYELVYNFSVNFSMSWIVQMMFFATQFVDRSSWHTCGINNCPKLSFPGRHGVSELLLDITVHQLLFFSWIAHQTHWDVTGLFDNLGFDGKMENCKFPKYVFSIKYLTFSHQILGNTVMSRILCLDLVASTAQHVETTCPKNRSRSNGP